MIQPAILFLKPSSLLPLSSQPTYCIASLFCLKPATIKISTQSNPTTLLVWLQSWHYFSIHLSIDLSLEITLGLSHSIFKPLPFWVNSSSLETRYQYFNERKEISNHTPHISLQPKQFQGYYPSFSGYLPTPSWIPTLQWACFLSTWATGSCSRR